MSDEESFVILGSSPMPSLEPDGGIREQKSLLSSSSIETDTPGSSFGSLKRSQLKDLRSAQGISIQTPPQSIVEKIENAMQASQVEDQMSTEGIITTSFVKNKENENNSDKPSVSNIQKQQQVTESMSKSGTSNAESKLWSRPPHIERNVTDVLSGLSLEDCAVPSPLESKKQQQTEDLNNKSQQPAAVSTSYPNSLEKISTKNNGSKAASSPAANNSLASSFIMGEINADVLKVSCSCVRR